MTNFTTQSKVILIDNQDSFTFNIVDLLRKFPSIELQVTSSLDLEISQLEEFNALIISPGPMTPMDFPILNQVIAFAEQTKKPLLGICLGHQAICSYFGAELSQLHEVIHGQQHEIRVTKNSRLFDGLPENLKVGLYHSWYVSPEGFPEELHITSQSDQEVIMAVEHRSLPIFGIQFHPESFLTPLGKDILTNFFAQVR